jgi:hypothetical protein
MPSTIRQPTPHLNKTLFLPFLILCSTDRNVAMTEDFFDHSNDNNLIFIYVKFL